MKSNTQGLYGGSYNENAQTRAPKCPPRVYEINVAGASRTRMSPIYDATAQPRDLASVMSASSLNSCRGAYALRAVNITKYTGAIMRLNRSTDNVTADFFWNSTSLSLRNATDQLPEEWGIGSTLTIAVWYDQSGVGNHATQVTVSLQPIYDPTEMKLNFRTNRFFDLPNATIPNSGSPYTVHVEHGVFSANGVILSAGATVPTSFFVRCWGSFVLYGYTAVDHYFRRFVHVKNRTFTESYDGAITRRGYFMGSESSVIRTNVGSVGTTNHFIGTSTVLPNNQMQGDLYGIYLFSTELSSMEIAYLSSFTDKFCYEWKINAIGEIPLNRGTICHVREMRLGPLLTSSQDADVLISVSSNNESEQVIANRPISTWSIPTSFQIDDAETLLSCGSIRLTTSSIIDVRNLRLRLTLVEPGANYVGN